MKHDQKTDDIQLDKLFITEIINDLHRNGFTRRIKPEHTA